MPDSPARKRLRKAVRWFFAAIGLGLVYVLLDFSVDLRPASVHSLYRFEIGVLPEDQPRILRQDNLSIVVIRRSQATISALEQAGRNLQDPDSKRSRQPSAAANRLRSVDPRYFVAYAIGTDLGCEVEAVALELKERCGEARYDFAGRALVGARELRNLGIPDYNFAGDFSSLTVRP